MTEKLPDDLAALVGTEIHVLDPSGLLLTVSDHESGSLFEVEQRDEWKSDFGTFVRLHDPEGLPLELWESPAE